MMKILIKWRDSDGGYIFDKDMGDFNNVEYIMIREVRKDE